jgi:hypothetical protein
VRQQQEGNMLISLTILLGLIWSLPSAAESSNPGSFHKWSLAKAVEMLNSSPWARHETFTHVIAGIGSGISGEKEIYNTFYVRFLSARPIREAYARIQQIESGYDKMTPPAKQAFDQAQSAALEMNADDWIVVAVGFRSNDPNEESSVRRFFQSETTETLRNKAFLSTPAFSQVQIAAYYPPREESVGAKFVFPRTVDGTPVVSPESEAITLELVDVPGAQPRLRATFSVKGMVQDGKLVL